MKKSAILLAAIALCACFVGWQTNSARQSNAQRIEILCSADREAQTAQRMPRVIFKDRHGKPV